jgi:hypothetical protein
MFKGLIVDSYDRCLGELDFNTREAEIKQDGISYKMELYHNKNFICSFTLATESILVAGDSLKLKNMPYLALKFMRFGLLNKSTRVKSTIQDIQQIARVAREYKT